MSDDYEKLDALGKLTKALFMRLWIILVVCLAVYSVFKYLK